MNDGTVRQTNTQLHNETGVHTEERANGQSRAEAM